MKFWNWGLIIIWLKLLSVCFALKNHSTLLCTVTLAAQCRAVHLSLSSTRYSVLDYYCSTVPLAAQCRAVHLSLSSTRYSAPWPSRTCGEIAGLTVNLSPISTRLGHMCGNIYVHCTVQYIKRVL